jgi:2,5-diketo-D-gluconate reductase B
MEQTMKIARHKIVANQMNYNVLYKDEVNQAFLDFCSQHNIQVIAYQPTKRQEVLKNQIVQNVASEYKATPAQIALSWILSKNAIPIPKSVKKSHIDDNLGALNLKLTDETVKRLDLI